MKNFLTSLLGALAALFLFSVGAFLLCIGIVGAIVSVGMKRAQPAMTAVESGSYLVYDLSDIVSDAPAEYDFGNFEGTRDAPLQLHDVIRAIHTAAADHRISGLLLTGSLTPGIGTGFGSLQELRQALLAFRATGKPVRAYLEFATTRDYYVASAANEIDLDPYGILYMPGLAVEPMFYAGAFEKYGIGVQVTRVGKYKNYVEPFTRQDMSPESRQETQRLLDDLWIDILSEVGSVRHLTPPQIQAVVDSKGLIMADAAKAARLVDRVEYRDQVIYALRAQTGKAESGNSFRQVSLAAYVKQLHKPPVSGAGRIAVVYAEGDIVNGEGEYNEIGGVRFARELRRLRQDDTVKAIVLRVNSPGGSASAAEDIQREVRLARQVKPVIVSMGSYAASGGYWISAYADRIFAEPTTITGSIGVFGIFFDIQKLAGNLGLTFDRVTTGKFADAMSISRPKTPEELAVLQNMVDWVYGQFIQKVAEGRKLPAARVEEIAQGRVWSGTEARNLHLVDEIGGLDAAIRYAARKAGVSPNSAIVEYPRKRTLAEALAALFGREMPELDQSRASLIGQVERKVEEQGMALKAFNDPAGVYVRLPLGMDPH